MDEAEKISSIKIAIGIPTLNRWDLLRPSLSLYVNDFPNTKIYVKDNGNQATDIVHKNVFYSRNPLPSVAASWNHLCRIIFEDQDYALILNDDIYLGKAEYTLKNLLYYHQAAFYTNPKDFSAFIMPKTTFETIGGFDEQFIPAYYEDADYLRRLKLSGRGYVEWMPLLPMLHRDNSTGEKDPSIYQGAKLNKQLYIKKWGGLPRQEKFSTPYNEKSKN